MRFILGTLLISGCLLLSAQEQFTHMQYNLTLYGNPFSCDESSNNSDEKDAALNVIVDYVQPDILTVNEMRDSDTWANRLLNNVLNDEEEVWSRAALTDEFGWSSIVNACYYRNDRFTLYDQEVVYQSLEGESLLRHIDLYTLYLNSPALVSGDTTFVTLVVAHLSAGDLAERADQTEACMSFIEARGQGNYILSGDFNIDSSSEESYQNLVNHADSDYSFIDPIDAPGTWHNNFSFADYHTQSTRYNDTNEGCFAPGGLDDRFDFTLISPFIAAGVDGLQYISDSYTAVGQSGNDYNQQLQVIGNQSVPAAVAQALYDASDHLPVKTLYSVDASTGLQSWANSLDFGITWSETQLEVWAPEHANYTLDIYDLAGRNLMSEQFTDSKLSVNMSRVPTQALIIRLTSSDGRSAHQVRFKH